MSPPSPERGSSSSSPPFDPGGSKGEAGTERLAALRRYHGLDALPGEPLNRITRLAASLFDVPIALISLLGADRQWFVSHYGLDQRETELETSFCARAIQTEGTMVVEDALEDERFTNSPLVANGPHARFYAGAPLVTPGGHGIGTLCLLDTAPRSFSVAERARLEDLASMAMDAFELHRQAAAGRDAKAAQERAEKLYEDLINGLPGIFYRLDEEGNIIQWNDHFQEQTGYRPAEIRAMHPRDFVRAEDHDKVEQAIRKGFADGIAQIEIYIESKDGTATPMLCYASRFLVDGQPHLAGMGVDITERKKAEDALRESKARDHALISHASDVTTVLDPDGTVRYESPALENVLGRAPGDFQGGNAIDTIHPEDREHYVQAMTEVQQTPDATVTVRLRVRHTDGSWVPLEAIARNLIHDPDVRGIVVNSRDVSDSMRFEAEREARQRAEDLLQAKTSFLNNMSHELRTPLAAIVGFADVLAEEVGGTHQEFAQRIARSGKRLQDTLNSVLSLAQLEGGGASIELEPVRVDELAEEAVALLQPVALEEGLTLTAEPVPAGSLPPRAALDAQAMHRVLDNLIGNALKFTEAGSVTVTTATSDDEVHLHVRDTGIGISEDFRSQLFDDFKQESSGLDRAHEGSGLGLTITQRLVKMMDGHIAVESTLGEGSRFTVSLPRLAEPTPEPAASLSAPSVLPRRVTSATLLLVEDNENTRALAEHVLKQRYDITTAPDAQTARTLAEERQFDLLLLDVNLAGSDQDGVGLLRDLRARPSYASVPAVAVTAHAMPGDQEQFLSVGFDAYLGKPFSREELLATVDDLLAPLEAA